MTRKLIIPDVRDLLPPQPQPAAPRDHRRHRTSQRALVAASLILCPREAGSRLTDR
jgi:hypothetical protein